MISRVHIENFKSLVNFDLPPQGHPLGGFTCLIGMNGAGKSTLLQAFDFIAHVAIGKVQEWLRNRDWKKGEMVSHVGKKNPVITFTVEMRAKMGQTIVWHEYEGSVFSTLKLEGTHPGIAEVKTKLQSLHSLELLAPQLMRRRSRESEDIGPGGERLAGFLSHLSEAQQEDLLTQIQSFYPEIVGWRVKKKQYGWKGLLVEERTMGGAEVGEGHINDAFLRVIAMLSQAYTRAGMLLLDEIENGMNPAMVGKLMDFLVALSRQGLQVIVTTHSPIILNFLDDEVAKEGVMLLYKNENGSTHACRYFDQPETLDKLRALGPGEVFADTDLRKMVARLAASAPEKENHQTSGK